MLEGKVRNEETDDVKLMLKVEKIFWREILGHNMMMMSWWNFKWLTKTRQMEWQQRRREWHSSWVINRYAPKHNHEKRKPTMNYDTALNQAISETISDTGAVIATEPLEAGGFFCMEL